MARRVPEPPEGLAGPDADPESVARIILLRRLEQAPRTRAQLAGTLKERGVPDEPAGRVLDRFEEVGLVDDELFARMWVESRHSGRALSSRALRSELRQRGVAESLIDEALSRIYPEQEREAARELARRRVAGVRGLSRTTQVRRLTGALARRGYGPGLAAAIVREVLSENADTEADAAADADADEWTVSADARADAGAHDGRAHDGLADDAHPSLLGDDSIREPAR